MLTDDEIEDIVRRTGGGMENIVQHRQRRFADLVFEAARAKFAQTIADHGFKVHVKNKVDPACGYVVSLTINECVNAVIHL